MHDHLFSAKDGHSQIRWNSIVRVECVELRGTQYTSVYTEFGLALRGFKAGPVVHAIEDPCNVDAPLHGAFVCGEVVPDRRRIPSLCAAHREKRLTSTELIHAFGQRSVQLE